MSSRNRVIAKSGDRLSSVDSGVVEGSSGSAEVSDHRRGVPYHDDGTTIVNARPPGPSTRSLATLRRIRIDSGTLSRCITICRANARATPRHSRSNMPQDGRWAPSSRRSVRSAGAHRCGIARGPRKGRGIRPTLESALQDADVTGMESWDAWESEIRERLAQVTDEQASREPVGGRRWLRLVLLWFGRLRRA